MVTLDENANDTVVQARRGDEIHLRLPENRTAGFRWQLDATGDPACVLEEESFEPPGSGPGLSGTRHWRFRCHAPGEGRIAAASRRSWEKAGSAGRTFDLTVQVSL